MRALSRHEEDLLAQAKAATPRDKEGALPGHDLENALADIINIDIPRQQRREAKRILKAAGEPPFVDDEQIEMDLRIPGEGLIPYFGERLIEDDSGRIIEESKSTAAFHTAEARRSRENAAANLRSAERKSKIADHHSAWALKEALGGRPALELSWDNCIKETGIVVPRKSVKEPV